MSRPTGMDTALKKTFEDLPDELLLSICRYLSPVHIFDAFLNLNARLNLTITFYRENIFLSHLSKENFEYLIAHHIPRLASKVRCLVIDDRSADHLSERFERMYNKIDQEFPMLEKMIFHQVHVDVVENFAWRFNAMSNLRYLSIDISPDRLRSMPHDFDGFLCGKLFSQSNTHQYLSITFDHYAFTLSSLKYSCPHLHSLTISINSLSDLWMIFDHFPNLQHLNITIGCKTVYDNTTDTYPYEHLWWKMPQLKDLEIKLEEKSLYRHESILPSHVLFKIIKNLYALTKVKFLMDIQHELIFRSQTTKEVYIATYFPFANGLLWQQALERNDNRTIQLEFHIEVDGNTSQQSKLFNDSDQSLTTDTDDIDFGPLLRSTFSNAFWLQRNINIEYVNTNGLHHSMYTKPARFSYLSTTSRMIERELTVRPLLSYQDVQTLEIYSHFDSFPPVLPLNNLFVKFPRLNHLKTDGIFDLPPIASIISTHLRSLTILKSTNPLFRQMLKFFPNLNFLSLHSLGNIQPWINPNLPPVSSIKVFKLITRHDISMEDLYKLLEIFPNLREFYLTLRYTASNSPRDVQPYLIFEQLMSKIAPLQYIETNFDIKHDASMLHIWRKHMKTLEVHPSEFSDGNIFRLKIWF